MVFCLGICSLCSQTSWCYYHRSKFRVWTQIPSEQMSRDMTKPIKWVCAQQRLRSAWHPPSLISVFAFAWRKHGSLATHKAHSEDSDQTGRMPMLIWVFAGRTVVLLVLSCRGSNTYTKITLYNLALSILLTVGHDTDGWRKNGI